MKAVVIREFGTPARHAMEEIGDPAIGAREVLVDVRAIGVNYPDLLVMAGRYQVLPPRPFIPGKDAAGVVARVGAGVSRFRAGDRVLAQVEHGAYAERLRALEDEVFPIPQAMPFEAAAALGLAYQSAHFALVERALYRPGETVLVNGATGGVGLAAIQLAKCMDARVLAGVTTAEKGELARANGADHVIDLAAPNLRESLREQVYAVTAGRGADVILDPLGGEVFEASLRAAAWRGRVVVIGFAAGRVPEIKANYLLVKNIAVAGLQWSDYRDREPAWVARVQAEIFAFYTSGHLKPSVMRTFALAEFAQALALIETRQVRGKLVLTV